MRILNIVLAEGFLINISKRRWNQNEPQKAGEEGRSWQEAFDIQAEGCAAIIGSCLEFLRPNKLNFTTALTWSEPENGPIRPENLPAGSHCHFSQSASVELYDIGRTTDSYTCFIQPAEMETKQN